MGKKLLQLTKRQENMLLIKKVSLLGNKQKKQQRKLKRKKTTKKKLLREKNKFLYIYLKKKLSLFRNPSLFFFSLSRGQTLRVISEETIQEGSGIYGASQRCPFFTRGCIPLRLNKLYKVCVHIIQ